MCDLDGQLQQRRHDQAVVIELPNLLRAHGQSGPADLVELPPAVRLRATPDHRDEALQMVIGRLPKADLSGQRGLQVVQQLVDFLEHSVERLHLQGQRGRQFEGNGEQCFLERGGGALREQRHLRKKGWWDPGDSSILGGDEEAKGLSSFWGSRGSKSDNTCTEAGTNRHRMLASKAGIELTPI